MPKTPLSLHASPATQPNLNADQQALTLAAEATLAVLCARAPTRLKQVSVEPGCGVQYATDPDQSAMRLNRGLLEDVVMVALAAEACADMLGQVLDCVPQRSARALLEASLIHAEEQAVMSAYLAILKARASAQLRLAWAEVQVVAAGLREHGALDAEAVEHRIRCAQGIRGTLLN